MSIGKYAEMFLWTVPVTEWEFFTLKMTALKPSKMFITIYQLTQ
jgi:hypothetical protein